MLATLVDEPFDDKKWVFEIKWDGFRLIAEKRGDTVRLWSRNGIDVTKRYQVLLPALQAHRRRLAQQLRQLGEVHRHRPRLVARQPIGRRAVRRSNMSGIGGEAEVQGLRLKRR